MKSPILIKSLEDFIDNYSKKSEKFEKELSVLSFNIEEYLPCRRQNSFKTIFYENKEAGYVILCDNLKSELSLKGQTYEEPFSIFFVQKCQKNKTRNQ